MWTVIIHKIPQGADEFFFYSALAGLLFAFWFTRRRSREYLWMICGTMAFMFIWRAGIQIISARYAAMLIFPCVILAAYAYCQSEPLLSQIPRFPHRLARLFPWLLFGGMVIFCLFRVFHLNPYRRHPQESHQAVRREAAQGRIFHWVNEKEARRTFYYTGIPNRALTEAEQKQLKNELKSFRIANAALLIDIQEPAKRMLGDGSSLDLPADAEWRLIYSSYTNRRRHRKHNIYRYRPGISVRRVEPGDVGNASGNLLPNGDLEKRRTPPETQASLPEFMRRYSFYRDAELRVPQSGKFWINRDGLPADKIALIELSDKNPLQGRYSLHITAQDAPGYFLLSQPTVPGDYSFSVMLRGTPGSVVRFWLNVFRESVWQKNRMAAEFILPDGGVYDLRVPIRREDCRAGEIFHPMLSVQNGSVTADDFRLTPAGSHTSAL